MLLQNPQLAYALLQAQVVMRIVEPQVAMAMLHRPNANILPIMPANDIPPQPHPPSAVPGPVMNHQGQPQMPNTFRDAPFAGERPSGGGGGEPLRGPGGPGMGQFVEPRGPPGGVRDFDMRDARPGFDRDIRGGPGGPGGRDPRDPGGRDPRDPGGRDPRDPRDREMRDPRSMQHDADMRGGPAFDPRSRSSDPRTPRGPGEFDRPSGPGPFEQRGHPFPDRNYDQRSPVYDQRDPRGPPISHANSMGPPGRPTSGQPLGRPGPPNPPMGAMNQAPISNQDQEKAALIMQVLQLSDQQIALLPPEQRQSIMVLKEQIALNAQIQ